MLHSWPMKGPDLLKCLIYQRQPDMNLSAYARALKKVKQPQIYKFLMGGVRHPNIKNLQAFADFHSVVLEVFSKEDVADEIAKSRGITAETLAAANAALDARKRTNTEDDEAGDDSGGLTATELKALASSSLEVQEQVRELLKSASRRKRPGRAAPAAYKV